MPSKPSKPQRQSQVLAGGTEICSSSGFEVGRGQKGCKKFRCRWRWVRLPQGGAGIAVQPVRAHPAAGAFAHRAGAVDRAAECGLRALDANGMQ